MRNVPDVAAVADATIWVIDDNAYKLLRAERAPRPLCWRVFAALANQQASLNHLPGIGFINPAIYAIGQGPAYASAFHDNHFRKITPPPMSKTGFFAVPGYDLCTGWGTPTGSNLINALLAPPDSLQITPASDSVITSPVGGPFIPSLEEYSLSNAGAVSLSWSWASEPMRMKRFSQAEVLPRLQESETAPALLKRIYFRRWNEWTANRGIITESEAGVILQAVWRASKALIRLLPVGVPQPVQRS